VHKNIVFSKKEIDEMYLTIGKNVKTQRQIKGISQLELSRLMGYDSVSLVSAAELNSNGKHFNLEHLYKISKILDIEISTLVELNVDN
jgi:transcriptional regulator with XRE-family HTH domain